MCYFHITLVVLLHYGWGVDHLARNFSQFLEAVQDIHTRSLRSDTPEKHKAEFILDLLRILESSIDDIDNVVEFLPFKVVGNLNERPVFTTNSCIFKA
jgi:hypothetical protein